ncbi:hypothetical protein EBR43_10875 [bacterium]|nr:hypothetical protein [bacterium]
MDGFLRDISPEEAKFITLQFMGQHLTGELKEMEKRLINKNNTLQGMTISPEQVLNTIQPGDNRVNRPSPVATTVAAGINIDTNRPLAQQAPAVQQIIDHDPNQLEFNFDSHPNSKLIFERLDSIDRKLTELTSLLQD